MALGFFIFVNLGFLIYILLVFYYSQLNNIKKDWPKYRCNPTYMLLADDIQANFTYCVQTVQTNFIGHLLQPLESVSSSLSGMMSGFVNQVNSIRGMISKIRDFTSSITKGIYSVFINLIIQFQKITIGMKDTFQKLIGILITIINIVRGLMLTFESGWKGPPGQMIRTIGGIACFHPDTKIKLKDGTIYAMKDLPLGAELSDGGNIFSVMKIHNSNNEPFYKIKGGVNDEPIYVTGSHFIYDKTTCGFIKVKDYSDAEIEINVKSSWFSCLITSSQHIPIGEQLFWDWEDDELTKLE
jgi:hypothetical protein